MKPLVKWSGGKTDELEKIKPHIPENYDTYIEPFVGGGAVFFDIMRNKAVINDIHPELINFYQQVKEGNSKRLYDVLKDIPCDENNYYFMRDVFEPENKFEEALKFIYIRKTCYRGMLRYNRNGKFNIPYGRYKTVNFSDLEDEGYGQLLNNTSIHNNDFSYIFENYNSQDNFCFIDQPYDSVFTDYGYCEFKKEDQERLANHFKNTNIKCLMVVGETDFIKQLYDGYIVETYPKKYKFKLHSGRIGDDIDNNHLIIKNY
jgi:DNA adenine methylase